MCRCSTGWGRADDLHTHGEHVEIGSLLPRGILIQRLFQTLA
jgi:hypothetical protein